MLTKKSKVSRGALFLSASLIALTLAQGTVQAQQSGESQHAKPDAGEKIAVSDKKAVAPSATVNLLNVLVEKGVITQEQADGIIVQADDEAFVARQAVKDATAKADEASKAASSAASAASPPGSKRVSYVPEIVRKQLKDELRKEVMGQAKTEGWASPGSYPEWAGRIRFYGDIRGRYEGIFHPGGSYNGTSDHFPNINAINNGSPYDLAIGNFDYAPMFNTEMERERYRLRARLGLTADLYDGFTAGLRIATGSDNSPVSTNQTLGGNFSKYPLWLDRAYLKYQIDAFQTPFDNYGMTTKLAIAMGRFDNPFWSPTDLAWDSDLGFDGVALQAKREFREGLSAFAVGGAFPIFNTSLDFASTERDKFKSEDKYLFGGQLGVNWTATPTLAFTFGAGLYDFHNVQGRLSTPCDVQVVSACDTDHLRPSFVQKGNTYMPLRDVIPPPGSGSDYPNPQYFGLASGYRPVILSGRADLGNFHPVHVVLDGEFVWNSAFDRKAARAFAINNRGPDPTGPDDDIIGRYEGGNMGWLGRVTVGHQQLTEFGHWNAHIGYKYLESDAVMDAFADSDFGLGGTNLKGYFLGANFALSSSVSATARWMSANSIAGAPYAVDILQVDLNAKF
ncbi:putative porin [Hyphomicrobium sp. CS1BSMeth3]|uniref:putative porin n=1 Tax=Hyphomicrobium sp. CS1BSMeth3 TaxID=1892844 RepID=UPI000930D3C9|nr:putative porin [Hyphomicrobium sp. CS1BSMeth3]